MPIPPGLVSVVPKVFSVAFRVRACAVLAELKNAERAAEQMAREYPGVTVSPKTILDWASGLNLKLAPGRPLGTPGNTEKTSPLRDRVLELWADGKGDKSQAEIARIVGTTRQNVFNLINRK